MKDDLISRSALLEKIQPVDFLYGDDEAPAYSGMAVSAGDIESAPAIDAVEVVRCKDCKFCKKHPTAEGYKLCTNFKWNNEYHPFTEDDYFCSYGKRRSE